MYTYCKQTELSYCTSCALRVILNCVVSAENFSNILLLAKMYSVGMLSGGSAEGKIDSHMEVKVEPLQCYIEEEHENGFPSFENASAIPSSVDVGALNLWTSKATTCLISQYKKYRSMVGQSTQIRSLREMFEMISLEMQNYGFYFSPQKCENKWRVLERKYKNLVFRERAKKPGRMRHYGQWEHKRALDEIFNEKRRHMYLEESDGLQPSSGSAKTLSKSGSDQLPSGTPDNHEDPLALSSSSSVSSNVAINDQRNEQMLIHKRTLSTMFEKFTEEMGKNFALAERNKERRHKEKMAVKQKELELKRQLLKLKEEKMELRKCQMIAAAKNLHLNMK